MGLQRGCRSSLDSNIKSRNTLVERPFIPPFPSNRERCISSGVKLVSIHKDPKMQLHKCSSIDRVHQLYTANGSTANEEELHEETEWLALCQNVNNRCIKNDVYSPSSTSDSSAVLTVPCPSKSNEGKLRRYRRTDIINRKLAPLYEASRYLTMPICASPDIKRVGSFAPSHVLRREDAFTPLQKLKSGSSTSVIQQSADHFNTRASVNSFSWDSTGKSRVGNDASCLVSLRVYSRGPPSPMLSSSSAQVKLSREVAALTIQSAWSE
jgi:hypothetical protein